MICYKIFILGMLVILVHVALGWSDEICHRSDYTELYTHLRECSFTCVYTLPTVYGQSIMTLSTLSLLLVLGHGCWHEVTKTSWWSIYSYVALFVICEFLCLLWFVPWYDCHILLSMIKSYLLLMWKLMGYCIFICMSAITQLSLGSAMEKH